MKNTQSKYTRMAHIYDWVEQRMPMNDFKKQAVNLLQGKILEVGIGSGANLKFYKKDSDVTGIDFSTGMLEIAKEKINTLNLNNVKLIEMNIENMNFPDNTFDSVLSTCVFCTVPNPKNGILEILRVLKPGGKAIFLEHMKSSSSSINIFLKFMNIITTKALGTSLLRETEKTIREVGFSKVTSKNIMMKDVVRLIIAEK
ncbi:class I SAM-dependent methyltransferase [Cetobacterium sp. 2A]|uniref:class I SAM-dependent methyltransferase n=1 Tax=unclassified Cetobacterium TaxID=2630983 RepID=UPI00163B9024|nr:class I SAM-dependent methyltransferase [Cetobacterium sp. 2A]MBC2857280.1 class I SAM-dependent methyltransferase [Cetobacterium sp. 2A]